MKGINFEEWKALVKKNRQALNTKSNIYRSEPESLTWGGPGANKADEYLQMHTITYNVTGMEVPSDWPTEIKSGKTLSLSIPAAPYGASQTVAANVDYTYTNNVLKINNVQNDITVTVNVGEVLYENAKLGDYLYSDWTFGPTQKTGYLGRCVGLAEHNNGKSVWCSPKSSTTMVWSTEMISTGTGYDTAPNARTATNGKENTAILLSLGADKYPAAAWAAQQFEGNGYLPAAGQFYNDFKTIVSVYDTFRSTLFHVAGEYTNYNSWYVTFSYYTTASPTVNYGSKTSAGYVASFIDLSGKPGKPINNNGHEYVDLGLPSGTLWATMNVGANSETDYGSYFQWGDTRGYTADQVGSGEGQKAFSWGDYKWTEDGGSTMSKYNSTDGKTVLDLEDDAARVNWGGAWKMPTEQQFQELLDNTDNEWTKVDNVNGYKFTSKTDNSKYIFIPAAGTASNNGHYFGCIWSSSLYSSDVKDSLYLNLYNGSIYMYVYDRFLGFSVRPVIV